MKLRYSNTGQHKHPLEWLPVNPDAVSAEVRLVQRTLEAFNVPGGFPINLVLEWPDNHDDKVTHRLEYRL